MIDKSIPQRIKSLAAAFAAKAKADSQKRPDYAKAAEMLDAIGSEISDGEYFAALEKLQTVKQQFDIAAYWLEREIGEAGMFSARKTELRRAHETVTDEARDVSTLVYEVDSAARAVATSSAAEDTDTLLAASERLKRVINSNYGLYANNERDIAEFLVLAAKNQQRQEKLIGEMAVRIAALEEKLAEYEGPRPIDKPKIRPPGARR